MTHVDTKPLSSCREEPQLAKAVDVINQHEAIRLVIIAIEDVHVGSVIAHVFEPNKTPHTVFFKFNKDIKCGQRASSELFEFAKHIVKPTGRKTFSSNDIDYIKLLSLRESFQDKLEPVRSTADIMEEIVRRQNESVEVGAVISGTIKRRFFGLSGSFGIYDNEIQAGPR